MLNPLELAFGGYSRFELRFSRAPARNYHAHLGLLLRETGLGEEALSHLSAAVRLEIDEADVHFARVELLLAAQREREGLDALRRTIGARPEWHAPINNLAWKLVTVSDERLRGERAMFGSLCGWPSNVAACGGGCHRFRRGRSSERRRSSRRSEECGA